MDENSDIIPFHTYLLKIASRCNINCSYCYIYNLADTSWQDQPRFMSEKVVRQTATRIREHCEAYDKKDISIVFHGGEPLLGGLKHLDMLASAIKDVLPDFKINFSMQSNGLLFTEEIGDFLLQRNGSIGVSMDGPPEVNDIHRVDHKGRPTSAKLEKALAILTLPKYKKVFAGFLCVVNIETDPVAVTKYLLSFKPNMIEFILPFNNYDAPPLGKENDLDASPYGDWLIKAFDCWIGLKTKTKVRVFNSFINMLCGGVSQVESVGLGKVDLIVIETNGEIEGVDSLKSTYDGATKLGYDIFSNDFDTVASHFAVRDRQLGAASLSQKCQACPTVKICGGGYLPNRYSSINGFDNPSVYCHDLNKIIRHIHSVIATELSVASQNRRIKPRRERVKA